MDQLVLWFNILGFSLILASFGVTRLNYGRNCPKWLGSYLLYLLIYALFTITNTYAFFHFVFLPATSPAFSAVIRYLNYSAGLMLLLVVPRFIVHVTGMRFSLVRFLPFIGIAVLFLGAMAASRFLALPSLDRIGSACLNGYLGIITLYGIVWKEKPRVRGISGVIRPFLYMSCAFYFIVFLQIIILPPAVEPLLNRKINYFTTGAICFIWGGMTLIYLLTVKRREDSIPLPAVSDDFVSQFGITEREKEVITLLLKGLSYKQISEKLFISVRTVEAHTYNIYRKCSVKNKIELSRLAADTYNSASQ